MSQPMTIATSPLARLIVACLLKKVVRYELRHMMCTDARRNGYTNNALVTISTRRNESLTHSTITSLHEARKKHHQRSVYSLPVTRTLSYPSLCVARHSYCRKLCLWCDINDEWDKVVFNSKSNTTQQHKSNITSECELYPLLDTVEKRGVVSWTDTSWQVALRGVNL